MVLSSEDQQLCQAACARQLEWVHEHNAKPEWTIVDEEENERIHLNGIAARCCVARALSEIISVPWKPRFKDWRWDTADLRVGVRGVYVRYVQPKSRPMLPVQMMGAHSTNFFIMVTGTFPEYEIVGWIDGGEARKKALYLAHRKPWAFFVLPKYLKPIQSLIDEVKEMRERLFGRKSA